MTISKVAARLKTEAAREPDHLYKGFIIRQDSAAKFNRPKGPPGRYFIYYSTGRRTGEAGQKTFEDAKKLVDWKIREQASVTKEQAASGPFTVKTEKNDLGKTEHYVYNGKKRLTPYKDYDVAVKEAKKLEDRAKKEESSVRGYEAYDWFAYGKPKALHLVSKGGTKVYLDKGDLFGVRKSANGKQIRMIVEKIGPTKVFTLSSDLANTLAKAAKATNAPSASRSDELEEDDGAAFKDFVEATGARLSKSLTKLKPILAARGYDLAVVKWLRKLSSLCDKGFGTTTKEAQKWETTFEKTFLQLPAKSLVKLTKDARMLRMARLQQTNALKVFLEEAADYMTAPELDMVAQSLSDLADHLELACALAEGNMRKADKMSDLDTSSREQIPDKVWDFLQGDDEAG